MPRHLTASAPEAAPPPPALPSDGGGRRPVPGEANFDTNMVIILAALLCALICALGLNSIVRCALRCGRRLAFETPAEAAARRTATGLKKKALRSIPVAVYGDGTAAGPAGPTWTECAICLGEFVEGEKVRVLPRCGHGFHVACVDTWLGSHSSCPTCRGSLIGGGGGGDGAGNASASGSGVRDEVS